MSEVMEAMSEMQDFDSARSSEFFFKLAAERFPEFTASRFSAKISDMLMIAESGVFNSCVMAERNSQEEKVEMEVGWNWAAGKMGDDCAEGEFDWVESGLATCG